MSEKDNWKWQKELLIKRDIEHQEEIERLNKELELYKDNQIHLNNQLEQKDNIIKEARELVKNECWGDNNSKCIDDLIYYKCDELLQILDKVGEE